MVINIDKLSKIMGRQLTNEELERIMYFEEAAKDPIVIKKANAISNEEDYYGPIMAACRKRAELSQEKLALMLNYSTSKIAKIETNNQPVKMDFLMEWSKSTNSPDFALGMMYGKIGIIAMMNKLKSEGYKVVIKR